MATKIFNPPTVLTVPSLDFRDVNKYRMECEEYKERLRNYLKRRKKGKNVGEIVRFPVGDGYAEYMVASMRPLELVHIPLWDAHSFPYISDISPKTISEMVENEKATIKIFGKG